MDMLGGQTPLQAAKKPNMDKLASESIVGLVKTIPDGMPAGSDVGNLSILGYDPRKYFTGRSPLEAVGIGIKLDPADVAFRCNFVTLSDENDFNDAAMVDYSAGEISTAEASELIGYLNKHFQTDALKFYTGVSYRHCLVLKDARTGTNLTPPHDISGQKIGAHLPKGQNGGLLLELMKKAYTLLKDHPVNLERVAAGKHPANCVWLWGEGRKAQLPSFREKYGLKGAVISAVDLIKGIGLCADMRIINVEGATGNIDTNFDGKAQAAIDALKNGDDFVFIHVEAPDECGHRFEAENKVKAIELIDEKVVGPVWEALRNSGGDYSLLLLPDHFTLLANGKHDATPVPFALYKSNGAKQSGAARYDEESCKASGLLIEDGYTLINRLFGR